MTTYVHVQKLENVLTREDSIGDAPNPFIEADGQLYMRYDQIRIDAKKDNLPGSPPPSLWDLLRKMWKRQQALPTLNVPDPLLVTFMWHGQDLYHVELFDGTTTTLTVEGKLPFSFSICQDRPGPLYADITEGERFGATGNQD